MMVRYPGQIPSLTFPSNPSLGQEYIAGNSTTYTWLGDRWSAAQSILNGRARYVLDAQYAGSVFDPQLDKTLDGGGA